MKKFISNLFIFLMVILFFNLVVFIFANDNYYKGYQEFPSKDFHSFIIADSHGLPLEKFSEKYNVFNFSTSSDSYLDMKRKVFYLIENDYKIDKIYLTVDNHTLSPYRENANNADKSIIYTSKIDLNYIKERYLKYYFPIFQIKVNPLLKNYLISKVKKIFTQEKKVHDNFKWITFSENERLKRAEERVLGQFPTPDKSEKLEKTLVEIINICKINNIELIGLKFPLSNSYIKVLEDRNYDADRVFTSHGLKVIDYQLIFKNDEGYFSDEDHLNSTGGQELTKLLLTK